jgi:hypothetical protein
MNTFVSINENYLPINEFEKYLNFSKQVNNWGNRDINNVWLGRVIYQNSIENFNYLKSVELKIKKEFTDDNFLVVNYTELLYS